MPSAPQPITVYDWWEQVGKGETPFLIVGKGPSFSSYTPKVSKGFHAVGLNHAVLRAKFDSASLPDVENIADCQEALEANCRFVLAPWHPHVGLIPTERTLVDFYHDYPVLERLAAAGRLVSVNYFGEPRDETPVIPPSPRNAAWVVNILAALGSASPVTIRTLGVDGGSAYGSGFGDDGSLGDTDFGPQFESVATAMIRGGVDYQHLQGKDCDLLTALVKIARELTAQRDDLRRHYDPLVEHANALLAHRDEVVAHRDALAAHREELLASQEQLLGVLDRISQM